MNASRCTRRTSGFARGFTLIELLLVVFILAAVAATAISLVDQDDQQLRYEDTQRRLQAIRRATVGPEPGPGPVLLGGFVADVGRLPATIQELLDPGATPAYQVDPLLGIGAGWRGPYLSVLPRIDGAVAFPDGWGLAGIDPPNYGWEVTVDSLANSLHVESYGSDGLDGGSEGYARDYPTAALVADADIRVDLTGWTIECTVVNQGGSTFTGSVRLRLAYPQDGSLAWALSPGPSWPASEAERNAASYLSLKQDFSLAPASAESRSFVFVRDSVAGDPPKLVPCGRRALILVHEDSGAPVGSLANGAGPPAQVAIVARTAAPVGIGITWRIP